MLEGTELAPLLHTKQGVRLSCAQHWAPAAAPAAADVRRISEAQTAGTGCSIGRQLSERGELLFCATEQNTTSGTHLASMTKVVWPWVADGEAATCFCRGISGVDS